MASFRGFVGLQDFGFEGQGKDSFMRHYRVPREVGGFKALGLKVSA